MDMEHLESSSIQTLEPFSAPRVNEEIPMVSCHSDLFILYVEALPLHYSFDMIFKEFKEFGSIKEIRNKLDERCTCWETWVVFSIPKDAHRACMEYKTNIEGVKCSLVEEFPCYLDIYVPTSSNSVTLQANHQTRTPEPARWLIVSSNGRGNLIKIKK